jgi:hypothetical protein
MYHPNAEKEINNIYVENYQINDKHRFESFKLLNEYEFYQTVIRSELGKITCYENYFYLITKNKVFHYEHSKTQSFLILKGIQDLTDDLHEKIMTNSLLVAERKK